MQKECIAYKKGGFMSKDLYAAPWTPKDFWEAMMEKEFNEKKLKSFCIHPDFDILKKQYNIPSEVNIREKIFSFKDSVCQFCGLSCAIDPRKRRKIPETHHIGNNFIFCPTSVRAIRTSDFPAGEICPIEIGGCGAMLMNF